MAASRFAEYPAMSVRDEISSISLNTVLFAMEFTPSSLRAYPYAADIAEHYGGKVLVSHIVPADDCDQLSKPEQVRLDKLLEAAARAGLSDPHEVLRLVPHEVVIDHGDICKTLLATADKNSVDLIVIGTHGRRGLKKLKSGSTADEIACLASTPVLILGPKASRPSGFERILYATDFSPAAIHALPYAVSLTQMYHAALLVLHVNNENSQEPPVLAAARTFEFLETHLKQFDATRVADSSKVIVDFGPTAELILEHALSRDVDLIVTGVHHLDGFRARMGVHLHGSLPYEVSSQAPCAVLTVPLLRSNGDHIQNL